MRAKWVLLTLGILIGWVVMRQSSCAGPAAPAVQSPVAIQSENLPDLAQNKILGQQPLPDWAAEPEYSFSSDEKPSPEPDIRGKKAKLKD